ncbi:acetate--CoA ligase [Baekduia sp.]|uniref:acetate--CoA ligase n=1 Tax=Baekduia sp. TaxID=2600305 RepID=UPI002E07AFFB|nr:acetate--CoA ligase [Baekduia sp.]
MAGTTTDLERQLAELLEQERFEPPETFKANALITDLSVHEAAAKDPVGWWNEQARALHWFSEPQRALNDENPPFYKWFEGGTTNASYNCLDRHVEAGLGDRVAFKWRGEEGETRDITYAWLLEQTQRAANALKDHGVGAGDVVGIFLPMIPEVVVAMLACSRIGAPHNVVFGGFSAESVKERMEFSEAKALITVDGARRKGKTAPVKQTVDDVGMPVATTFVVRHTGIDCPMGDGDVFWDEALAAADASCPPAELDAEHPLFILYSSGSTAKPKGILHSTGGYLTHVAWTHKHVFDLKPESDVYWCSADVGWITGHSYIVYGPLLNAATSVMYEGAPDYPHKGIWWELCEKTDATIFYTAPTAIRACIKWGVEHVEKADLSKLRLLGSVGEPINPKAWLWYWKIVGGGNCPVVDTWWQTETGGIMITTLPGAQAMKPGIAGTPLPGVAAAVVDEEGEEVSRGTQGLLSLSQPWPGMLRTLYGDDDRYISTYWEKWGPEQYLVGDASKQDDEGYISVIGRVDDVLNVSGHRMSTAEIESAIVSHGKVAEAAVIGATDEDTGQSVAAFVTLEGDLEGTDELVTEIREHVAVRIGKLARPKRIIWAADLPKTRSGKIMRRLLRDIGEGRELGDVTTLRDPGVVKDLETQFGSEED